MFNNKLFRRPLSVMAFMASIFVSATTISCTKDDDDKDNDVVEAETFSGKLTVTFKGSDFTTDNTIVRVSDVVFSNSDKTQGTLSLIFEKVKFVPQMPVSLDITVPGVAFKIVSKNKAEISGNGIVPLTGGKEYEMYSVTGLTGKIVDDNDSSRSDDSISFSLKFGNFPTSYSGVEAD